MNVSGADAMLEAASAPLQAQRSVAEIKLLCAKGLKAEALSVCRAELERLASAVSLAERG